MAIIAHYQRRDPAAPSANRVRLRTSSPIQTAPLEEAIGGPLNQRYIGAEIVADIDLGLTNAFRLVATISNIVEIRPYRDF
jgi:hypothetical protein